MKHSPLHPRVSVIVTRAAYADSPDKVIRVDDTQSTEDILTRYYPGAKIDDRGGFDTPDGDSYHYDRALTE
ncbi:hypothetical protein O4214_05495 [Rhodococcus erythropolis]|uniref:hypothetical protein n=1 Tax=Rhodococcus erythropolis TaxID=1833 RepID=UPI001E54DF9D|nr:MULTISPECIES: hypothetical protein [Rhodococcus erythropolis group]MCD2104373.1 hypothetical protein [Rhodococcus qingshengii]MCZ4523428.1 hypothetical protein [Rhodococcus erythropolis]